MSRNPQRFVAPELIEQFIAACRVAGHEVIVTSVDRSFEEQQALYAQGREALGLVNALRRLAGLSPLTDKENKRRVTWTLNSRHFPDRRGRSHAFDFGIVRNGAYVGDVKADLDGDTIPDYLECARIGEALGLVSGRHFRNPDYPHLEMPQQAKDGRDADHIAG
ncbi:MAG TPA: M15 family metallopeptidase [Dissulfurispiraceae bacterium]|nr:M15 family metallopeptidase [Dissulfurispiraceae bacterium]